MSVELHLPDSKTDIETARALVEAGYPAVAPVLGELIEWLQDYNWPVAKVLEPLLVGVGTPLIPYIDRVFAGDDETWKYWIIVCLISESEALYSHYRDKLIQLAVYPSPNDSHHELDEVARDALIKHGENPGDVESV